MEDSCIPTVRALAIWSGAVAGLMMILVGGLIPSALIIPELDFPIKILNLPSNWQVPCLLITALVCGPRAAAIASIAYLTIGLWQLPVFHGGGSLSYITTPGFGYLTGFLPAAWLSGRLAQKMDANNLIYLTLCAFCGVLLLQSWGMLYLLIGSTMNIWTEPLPALLFSYSIVPLPAQIILCPAIGLLSLALRFLLFIE